MSISNEQILGALLTYYKSRGVDLVHLLSDPIFSKMPLLDKINFLKENTATLLHGSSESMSKEEKSTIAGTTATYGIMGGLASVPTLMAMRSASTAAGKSIGMGPTIGASVGLGIAVGAVLGSMAGLAKAKTLKDRRSTIRNQLLASQRNPTLSNHLGTLSSGALHDISSGPTNTFLHEISGYTRDSVNSYAPEKSVGMYNLLNSHYNSP